MLWEGLFTCNLITLSSMGPGGIIIRVPGGGLVLRAGRSSPLSLLKLILNVCLKGTQQKVLQTRKEMPSRQR